MEVLQSLSPNTFLESHYPDIHGTQGESITLAPEVLTGIHALANKVIMDSPSAWHPTHLWKAHSIRRSPKGVPGCQEKPQSMGRTELILPQTKGSKET